MTRGTVRPKFVNFVVRGIMVAGTPIDSDKCPIPSESGLSLVMSDTFLRVLGGDGLRLLFKLRRFCLFPQLILFLLFSFCTFLNLCGVVPPGAMWAGPTGNIRYGLSVRMRPIERTIVE